MSPARLLTVLLMLRLFGAAGALHADAPKTRRDDAPPEKTGPEWSFNLLPKSFQKRPALDMTYFTEMTDAGRKLTPPSSDAPAYYVIQAGGAHELGDSDYRLRAPSESDLKSTVTRALAAASYHESDEQHPPTLAIVYQWGVHTGVDRLARETDPNLALRNLYERAALVGGYEFANRWVTAIVNDSENTIYAGPESAVFRGVFSAEQLFETSDRSIARLMEQARGDVYFAVATAYDASALARGERVALWRTKMTVTTEGLAMWETLSPLIAASTPFLGREMEKATPMTRRIHRDGRVELGPTEVLGYEDPTAEPAPEAKSGEPPSDATKEPDAGAAPAPKIDTATSAGG